MQLVNVFKSAALGYGTEKRVILLHGCRQLEVYNCACSKDSKAIEKNRRCTLHLRMDRSAVWRRSGNALSINEEPLHLIPQAFRAEALSGVGIDPTTVTLTGELNPSCRFVMRKLMEHYSGDLSKSQSCTGQTPHLE